MSAPAAYNPRTLGRDAIIARFVARRALLERILEEIRRITPRTPPPHQLIVGQRGMGKTMLLAMLGITIEEDPALSGRWASLGFPEEQYNVSHLSDLWVNCLDALADRLDRGGAKAEAQSLDRAIDALRGADELPRRREALDLLRAQSERLDRGFVLLLDNVDLILERLGQEDWALREVLSEQPWLLLVGTTCRRSGGRVPQRADAHDRAQGCRADPPVPPSHRPSLHRCGRPREAARPDSLRGPRCPPRRRVGLRPGWGLGRGTGTNLRRACVAGLAATAPGRPRRFAL